MGMLTSCIAVHCWSAAQRRRTSVVGAIASVVATQDRRRMAKAMSTICSAMAAIKAVWSRDGDSNFNSPSIPDRTVKISDQPGRSAAADIALGKANMPVAANDMTARRPMSGTSWRKSSITLVRSKIHFATSHVPRRQMRITLVPNPECMTAVASVKIARTAGARGSLRFDVITNPATSSTDG